jgi:acetolactate synthase small subunit
MFPSFRDGIYKGNGSYVDITKKETRGNITKRKKKYSNIIANMNLGLIEVDQNDRF